MRKAKLNLFMNELRLQEIAKIVGLNIKENPIFVNPPVELDDFLTLADTCEKLYREKQTGSKEKIAAYNATMMKLRNDLRRLINFVNSIAEGNVETIIASGMEVSKEPTSKPVPMQVEKFNAIYSGVTAMVILAWAKAKYGEFYVAEYTTNPEAGNWIKMDPITARKMSVDGLTTGKKYWFRVAAYNNKGKGVYSDIVEMMAA